MEISKYPIKIRILMVLKEGGEQWTTELTDKVIAATGQKPSKRLRKNVKSFLVEMDMRGNVLPTDSRPVDPEYYGSENITESKYVITDRGLDLLKKVN